jgi:hypothetical protein
MMPVKNQLDSIESITFEKKSIRWL